MRICRFDNDRVGVIRGDEVIDVTDGVSDLLAARYPYPPGDPLIANLGRLRSKLETMAKSGTGIALGKVRLLSPVANPDKIIGAPVNYEKHIAEGDRDKEIRQGRPRLTIGQAGLFLKANSSLVGPHAGVALRFLDRRTDHEVELAAIIGRKASDIPEDKALDFVAGYAIGLDMTVRGPEDRSFRKSVDTYSVLGPWLVTRDEIADPGRLDLELTVNGEPRQSANTSSMIYSVAKQIAWASTFYTLYPGDVIMTGTPEGVGPVKPGDVMRAKIETIGAMDVHVRAHA
jgi:2-keto-4-pentenoate hydratase/2-oxohepta-3-ene-1,7-dioic acid hydratase in catechol pathway